MQAGDVAFSVPNSLVVTLERVLGNETIGNLQFLSFSISLIEIHCWLVSCIDLGHFA